MLAAPARPTAAEDVARTGAAGLLAGLLAGFAFGAVGGRLAMRLVAIQSSDAAQGLTTDDGAATGEITLAGTLNLGAFLTIVGAAGGLAYVAARALVPPAWRARATGTFTGVVGGAMVVSTEGVDFTFLGQPAVSIAVFVALLFGYGWATARLAERFLAPDGLARRARLRRLLVTYAVLLPGLLILPAAAGLAAVAAARHKGLSARLLVGPARALAVALVAWSAVGLVRDTLELV